MKIKQALLEKQAKSFINFWKKQSTENLKQVIGILEKIIEERENENIQTTKRRF